MLFSSHALNLVQAFVHVRIRSRAPEQKSLVDRGGLVDLGRASCEGLFRVSDQSLRE